MSVTIEQDLKEVLVQINNKLDNLQINVNALTVNLETVKGEIKSVKTEITGMKEDIKELKNSQKAQIWSLIVLAFTAVLGLFGAMVKVLFLS